MRKNWCKNPSFVQNIQKIVFGFVIFVNPWYLRKMEVMLLYYL